MACIQPINSEDMILWPNGDWCYRHELAEFGRNKSDDFETIPFATARWHTVMDTVPQT